jgi:hypothetical protein
VDLAPVDDSEFEVSVKRSGRYRLPRIQHTLLVWCVRGSALTQIKGRSTAQL